MVYGDTAHDGAFFTLVSAGLGLDTKYISLVGQNGRLSLVLDAVSYPPQFATIAQSPTATSSHPIADPALVALGCLLAGVAAALDFYWTQEAIMDVIVSARKAINFKDIAAALVRADAEWVFLQMTVLL